MSSDNESGLCLMEQIIIEYFICLNCVNRWFPKRVIKIGCLKECCCQVGER
jgi:hypothetical protein